MKSLRLTLCPEQPFNPVYEILTEEEYIDSAQLVHWNIGFGGLPTLLFYVEGDQTALAEALGRIQKVKEFDITYVADDQWYLYLRAESNTIEQTAYSAFTEDGLILIPPFEYSSTGVSFDIIGDSESLQRALDRIPSTLQYRIEQIGEYSESSRTVIEELSVRQREAVRTACDLGYYDVPRQTSIKVIAEQLGCAPPTAAEHLRKAESKLLQTIIQ